MPILMLAAGLSFKVLAWIPLLLLLATFPYGLYLLITGLRGKKIDQHPLCRKCGFDLTGRNEEHTTCSECGVTLDHAKAIVHGNRTCRPRRIVVGSLLLALCLLIFVPIATHMNWTSHLPVWALRMQANRDMPLADEAWRLLGDRLNPNTKLSTSLSTSQIQSLITDVLALQADTKHPWRYEAGVFLEGARMWDMVNDQDWNAYVKTAYQQAISFHIRPNVNHGEDIPIALRSDNFRLGTFGIRYHYGQGTFSIDGQVIRSEPIGFGACVNAHHYSDKGWSDLVRLTDKQWQDIKPGEHQFKVQMRVFLLDTRHSSGLVSDYNLLSQEQIDALPDVAYCDQSFEKTFNILPTDAVDAVSITPEDHRKAVESAFTVNYLEYQPNRGRWVLRGWISNLPVNLACDILICFGDKTYPLSSIKIKGPIPSGSRVSYLANGWEPKLNDLTLEKVDLRLVPSRKVAQRTIDMKEYWGDEILIKDVPVVIENDAQ